MKNALHSRAIAAIVLGKVIKEGLSFHPSLVRKLFPKLEKREEAFVSYLCFGVLRYYPYLQQRLNGYLDKPLKSRDSDIECLMLVGLYQLFFNDTPDYAVINSTVEASLSLKKRWAKGLINGVLRQAQRAGLKSDTPDTIARKTHPAWLIQAIEQSWPEQAGAIFTANMALPPLVLRVNTQKTSVKDYLLRLQAEGIEATPLEGSPHALVLKEAVGVEQLPHFMDGWVSVQDGGAQLTGELLELKPGLRILDACAAPGGKMAHLLEQEPLLKLTALEKDPQRFERLKETVKRLQLNATLQCADATEINTWWDQTPFDCIIIDAPCSATGILRRHPDIKLHRQADDLTQLTKTQGSLLRALWPLLKPSGILIYVTCSLLPVENVEQINQFMEEHLDAKEWPISESFGLAQTLGRQLLPGLSEMDGFYYARLQKQG